MSPPPPPNEFPTFAEVLSEASPLSLSELALMSPEEMGPAAELAYIEHLREMRVRYERALGVAKPPKAQRSAAKPARGASLATEVLLDVDLSGDASVSQEDLF